MPEMRMNSLKSLAMNCGPLSEMIRGLASGCFSLAASRMISMSASVIDSRRSQCTIERLKQSSSAQHAPHAGRTHRHDVGVQHHEGQPPVALQRVLQVERDDGLLLPLLQPKVPGNPTVVLVDATIAFSPIVELA